MKVLTRYLRRFSLTPDTYRAKWGLPKDYPMIAPDYAARRSALAKQLGLGTATCTAEQSARKVPHLPVKAEKPTVPVAEPQHTAASVFAKFPDDEGPAKAASAANDVGKFGRKRFAQQSIRIRVGQKK